MSRLLRPFFWVPAALVLVACGSPTETRLPPDGEPPKEPPPDGVSYVLDQPSGYA